MTSTAHSGQPTTAQRPGWTLTLVSVTTFMLVLDITVVVVALPDMQSTLYTDLPGLQWVIDAYTLAVAAFLLTAATLGDRIGRRRLFSIGTAVFTIASLACAMAPAAAVLDGFRVVQGLGGAVLFGVGLPLIAAAYPEGRARNGALAIFGAASGTAVALGPVIGGLLTQTLGWRSIFYLNVPIGIFVLLAAWRRLVESHDPTARRPDWMGTTAVTIAAFTLVFALVRGNAQGWGSPIIVASFAGAGAAFAGFVVIELRVAAPMFDLALFRNASFAANACVAFTVQATLLAALTYLSLYVQNTLGFDPIGAGIRFLPFTAVAFIAAIAAGPLLDHLPSRFLVAASAGFAAAGLLVLAHLNVNATWPALVPGLSLAGIGLGLVSTVVNQVALAAVPPERAGMASGAINSIKQIGVAAGVAGLGAVFTNRAATTVTDHLAGAPTPPAAEIHALSTQVANGAGARVAAAAPPALRPVVDAAARAGTISGLNLILLLAGVAAALAAIAGLVFSRTDNPRRDQPGIDSGRSARRPGPIGLSLPAGPRPVGGTRSGPVQRPVDRS